MANNLSPLGADVTLVFSEKALNDQLGDLYSFNNIPGTVFLSMGTGAHPVIQDPGFDPKTLPEGSAYIKADIDAPTVTITEAGNSLLYTVSFIDGIYHSFKGEESSLKGLKIAYKCTVDLIEYKQGSKEIAVTEKLQTIFKSEIESGNRVKCIALEMPESIMFNFDNTIDHSASNIDQMFDKGEQLQILMAMQAFHNELKAEGNPYVLGYALLNAGRDAINNNLTSNKLVDASLSLSPIPTGGGLLSVFMSTKELTIKPSLSADWVNELAKGKMKIIFGSAYLIIPQITEPVYEQYAPSYAKNASNLLAALVKAKASININPKGVYKKHGSKLSYDVLPEGMRVGNWVFQRSTLFFEPPEEDGPNSRSSHLSMGASILIHDAKDQNRNIGCLARFLLSIETDLATSGNDSDGGNTKGQSHSLFVKFSPDPDMKRNPKIDIFPYSLQSDVYGAGGFGFIRDAINSMKVPLNGKPHMYVMLPTDRELAFKNAWVNSNMDLVLDVSIFN